MPAAIAIETASPVTLSLAELEDPSTDLHSALRAAYGPGGLGLLVVTGVAGVAAHRSALLPLARALARLPAADLAAIEHAASHYSVGWSHGREKMSRGRPDTGKGSFYANPLHDDPSFGDAALVKQHPTFVTPNVWPAALPELREAFRAYAGQIVGVAKTIAGRLDSYVARELAASGCPPPPPDVISQTMDDRACTGRLLYYFPTADTDSGTGTGTGTGSDADDGWCGYHNDHGSLTGLSKSLFFSPSGEIGACPDPAAGLYIRARDGRAVKVAVPDGALAFQIGETAQVVSGGVLRATPHYVRGPSREHAGWSRAQLAVFSGPSWDVPMAPPAGRTVAQALEGTTPDVLPPGVPALATRWTEGMTFGEFGSKTIAAYHQ